MRDILKDFWMKIIKNILICGVGGVGGYFGGIMAYNIIKSSKKIYNIYFYTRGNHLKEIQKKGLELHKSDGKLHICQPTLASDNIDDIPSPDICIISVKSYDLDDLVNTIKDKLSEDTIIIALMNGIDIYKRIRKNLKKCIVLPSCVYIGSHIEKPGVIIHSGNPGFFVSGFDPSYPDFNPKYLIDFFSDLEIDIRWIDDPTQKIWEKYFLVASFALVSAHTNKTLGEIINDKNSYDILVNVMKEIILIVKAQGIRLSETIIKDTIEFCKNYPDVKPSYVRDLEKGGYNEGDLFGDTLIHMSKKFKIEIPTIISINKS